MLHEAILQRKGLTGRELDNCDSRAQNHFSNKANGGIWL
jgi:hypothetical protein